ncbi:cohesin domain-containing protein [Chloroflexota bacterium]
MKFTRNTSHKALTLPLFLTLVLALVGMVWIQASISPVSAQEPPAEETGMSVQIIPVEDFGVAGIDSTPVFEVGDIFRVSIVAQNVEDPGIFGSQFEITFEADYLQVIGGSLVSGSEMEPVVIAVSEVDNEAGVVKYAASRQGNLENLVGNVVLATLSFEAVGATEPPEGQTTTVHLQSAKLGAKGGIEVPVAGLVDLDVIIREDGGGGGNGEGDMIGNVKVEGRADDNQAGHSVNAMGDLGGELGTVTDANGDFLIEDAPADTYSLTANSAGFLAAACTGVEHVADALTTLADTTLLAGDIDDSGTIDITDAVAIGSAFGSTEPGEISDLNADGVVDILDLILMSVNFGQASVDNPWLCQSPATEL